MLFNSLSYLIFLPVTVILFWLIPFKYRTAFLLLASYIFYMSWKPIYGILMLILTVANYLLGLAIDKYQPRKRLLLWLGIIANLLTLGYFKYTYFAYDSASGLLKVAGMQQLPPITFNIILPLGISFFAFEFIHYLVDVYKGSAPIKEPLEFALFPSFFPTQIAGPIKRYQDFVPQLKMPQKLTMVQFNEAIELIIFGLFKKVVLADSIASVVNRCYARPDSLTNIDAVIVVWAFAFQLYFDFSGYTDIARGSALLLGFKVPLNFNLPYMSGSLSELWQRWHISLTSWLRDYLFIPLGGSRNGELNTLRNIFLTMTIAGLWHGAGVHFLIWGMQMGVMLILLRLWQKYKEATASVLAFSKTPFYRVCSIIVGFNSFAFGIITFRATTLEAAMLMLKKAFFLGETPPGCLPWQPCMMNCSDSVIYVILPFLILGFFLCQIMVSRFRETPGVMPAPRWFPGFKAVYLATLVIALLTFCPDSAPQFIYFQF